MPISKTDVAWLRVYPPLGIARVGNADPGTVEAPAFVIGPEIVGGPCTKPDGSPARRVDDFRTADGMIRRQAARFRLYAGLKNGSVVELTSDDCTITWTVSIANLKAGWYEFNQAMDLPRGLAQNAQRRNAKLRRTHRECLDITPAPRVISGRNQGGSDFAFDDGAFWGKSVYLGELRTDPKGRLTFIGGKGVSAPFRKGYNPTTFANNNGWHDDIADGPVHATAEFADGRLDAVPGYVVTTPPNFAPGLQGLVTMDDAVRETFYDQDWLPRPEDTSFTQDVWPIFDRLTGMQWVDHGLFMIHGAGSPLDARAPGVIAKLGNASADNGAWRQRVFGLFRDPDQQNGGFVEEALPQIFGDAYGEGDRDHPDPLNYLSVTRTQYGHLRNWAQGHFKADWDGLPQPPAFDALTPAQQVAHLERAALHDCLGGPFHPGIELTWTMRLPKVWASAYRLHILPGTDPAPQDYGDTLTPDVCMTQAYNGVAAGSLTRFMGVPWQTDGTSCNSDADYEPSSYLSMPTFWGPRVPDQVFALSDYQRAASLDPAKQGLQATKHFALRSDWLRDVRGRDYYDRLVNMINDWQLLGMVLPVPAPPPHLPADTRAEMGRVVPDHGSYQNDPKYKLVTRIETVDAEAPPAGVALAAEVEEAPPALPSRPRRRFRQGEV
ncbi:LodA/GoxA family CTQ-dependent oxidase [Ralstonia syzygii]|nr:LodA/GoxA family CTQ-dependent oxidase [Ralstonia syzygii]CCA79550.1 putative catalase fragment [blood disease bacterium R229]